MCTQITAIREFEQSTADVKLIELRDEDGGAAYGAVIAAELTYVLEQAMEDFEVLDVPEWLILAAPFDPVDPQEAGT